MIWRCGRLGKLRLKNADDAFDESSCQFGRRRLGDMVLILGGCAMADGVRAVTKVPLYRILFFCLLLLSLLPCCKELLSFRQGLGQVRQSDCFWKNSRQRRYPRSSLHPPISCSVVIVIHPPRSSLCTLIQRSRLLIVSPLLPRHRRHSSD
jgi:hypothetical protein